MQRQSKADLHVHSKYSDRPAEWFLRRVGAPECFVEPLEVYRRAKRRGMDFVTIADHNSIRGALEIAHLPGAFSPAKSPPTFPKTAARSTVLVCGVDEAQFQAIQRTRENIYDLHRCLTEKGIFAAVPPALSRQQPLEDRAPGEAAVDVQAVRDDQREPRPAAAVLMKAVLDNLTPQMIAEMAERHGIEPTGPDPWRKWSHRRQRRPQRRTRRRGVHGDAARGGGGPVSRPSSRRPTPRRRGARRKPLSHSLYTIAYSYYKSRFLGDGKTSVVGKLLDQLLTRLEARSGRLSRLAPGFVKRLIWARRMRSLSEVERLIVEEVSELLASEDLDVAVDAPADNRRIFAKTCRLAHLSRIQPGAKKFARISAKAAWSTPCNRRPCWERWRWASPRTWRRFRRSTRTSRSSGRRRAFSGDAAIGLPGRRKGPGDRRLRGRQSHQRRGQGVGFSPR